VRPRISFSPGLQFEDVVAFVPPVYTRYQGATRESEGNLRNGREVGREGENRESTCTRKVYALARSYARSRGCGIHVGDVGTNTPVPAFLPRTLGVVLPFSSSTPRLTCPISPHWPRECEHVQARFESRGREAQRTRREFQIRTRSTVSARGAQGSTSVVAFATIREARGRLASTPRLPFYFRLFSHYSRFDTRFASNLIGARSFRRPIKRVHVPMRFLRFLVPRDAGQFAMIASQRQTNSSACGISTKPARSRSRFNRIVT